ncbi:MAG: V-type ATP synthase subunit A [Clostridia bacterium]|nr:V-type ATP synthase subunit A [Clostridia bacterium]
MEIKDVIYGINGPVVTVKNTESFSMMEMVYVGNLGLIGEVIKISDKYTTIQVYEETTGLKPGEPVIGTKSPMNITLGPGILDNIFDGIARPLKDIRKESGSFIARGSKVPSLDIERKWKTKIIVKPGDKLKGGDIYAVVEETRAIEHRCMLHPYLSGVVQSVNQDGEYKIDDTVVTLKDETGKIHKLSLFQRWPIRTPRPSKKRHSPKIPLITGQRVIDTLFPMAKGGSCAIPGGFGTGKTMTQHQIAKWCDADIIVYVGCGERGNEMCQVLNEFSELIDPKTGDPMTDRTVLIANTSNMPVAAREASIYTGITLAEYYRDMGYHVAMMADSSSRWAEALREISGRLEEMPAEEGFPADLPSRLSEFYERAGFVTTLNDKEGSVSVIGAVSPQGGDFSEPVTQNTKRFTRCFWALDKSLAYARHYPAINWLTSYSEYFVDLDKWYHENIGHDFIRYRTKINSILHEESSLMEIVKLIGADVLPDDQKLIIETARVIRVGFLQQNAFHKEDTYVSLEKQKLMMKVILKLHARAKRLISAGVPISQIKELGVFDRLAKIKYEIPNDKLYMFDEFLLDIDKCFAKFSSRLVKK